MNKKIEDKKALWVCKGCRKTVDAKEMVLVPIPKRFSLIKNFDYRCKECRGESK